MIILVLPLIILAICAALIRRGRYLWWSLGLSFVNMLGFLLLWLWADTDQGFEVLGPMMLMGGVLFVSAIVSIVLALYPERRIRF